MYCFFHPTPCAGLIKSGLPLKARKNSLNWRIFHGKDSVKTMVSGLKNINQTNNLWDQNLAATGGDGDSIMGEVQAPKSREGCAESPWWTTGNVDRNDELRSYPLVNKHSYWKWWFSIVMLVYQRVPPVTVYIYISLYVLLYNYHNWFTEI